MGQRLIDAEALGIGKVKREAFVVPEIADGWNAVIDIIAHAPTVDAVPVVRCRECKHAESYQRFDGTEGAYCHCPNSIFKYANEHVYTPARDMDDFCSYGEKKED